MPTELVYFGNGSHFKDPESHCGTRDVHQKFKKLFESII